MIFKYEICDSCETVQHCRAFGCVPIKPTAKTSPEHLLALTQTAGLELDKVIEAFKLAKPPAQHQPVATVAVDGVGQIQVGWITKPQHNDKLYTQQPAQHQLLTEKEISDLCPQFEDPMRREMWITGFKAAHGIRN